jgi:hypothetical protein
MATLPCLSLCIAALCWAVIFVSVVRVYFTSRPSGLKLIGICSLLYVLVNTPSMLYVLSLYFQESLNDDTVCFRYFSDGECVCVSEAHE